MKTSNFLAAGGEMGATIRELDWSATPIGPIDTWPPSLRITLSTILSSPLPACLMWGPQFTILNNDAFSALFTQVTGQKPVTGIPAGQGSQKAWNELLPLIKNVYENGEGILNTDLPIADNEKSSKLFQNAAISPVFNDHGQIEGVLLMITPTLNFHAPIQKQSSYKPTEISYAEMVDLFENAPVAFATLGADDDLCFLGANRFYGELVGRNTADIVGKPLLEALPEIEGQGFDQLLKTVIRSGISHTAYEVPVILKRNNELQTVYLNFSYVPRLNKENSISGILVTAIDVTAQVRSRMLIEEKEALLRSIINAAPFPIGVYVGEKLRILHANPAIIDVYGKGPDVIGKGYLELLPELMAQGIGQQVMDVFESGVPFFSETSRVDIDVKEAVISYYFKYSFIALFDDTGNIYGVLNTGVDVTEVETARQRALEAESRLRSAVELAELANWTIHIPSRSILPSERLKAWIGTDESSIDIVQFYELIPGAYRETASRQYQAAFENSANNSFDIEHPLIHQQTGHQRFVHVRGQIVPDSSGKSIRLTGTMQDITQQRAIQWALERQVSERTTELARLNTTLRELNNELEVRNNELKHSNEELSQYAYVTSHDLQEPLRKIRMYISWLQEKFEMPPQSAELLEKINKSSGRMIQLIKDLLAFSRLLGGDLIMQDTDLHKIVSGVLEDFELAIQEKNATVKLDPLPTIPAVSLQMNQLFHNLIGNALKFSAPDRTPVITISLRHLTNTEVSNHIPLTRYTDFYEIKVSDNGIGFEQQFADYIFELFRQLHTHNKYPGSGIGLALCRRIANNHGGHIYATSVIGQGSSFYLILPVMIR